MFLQLLMQHFNSIHNSERTLSEGKAGFLLNLDHKHEAQLIDCSKWIVILEQNSH